MTTETTLYRKQHRLHGPKTSNSINFYVQPQDLRGALGAHQLASDKPGVTTIRHLQLGDRPLCKDLSGYASLET